MAHVREDSIIHIIYDSDSQNQFHSSYYNSNECRLSWAQTVMQVLKAANDCAFEMARLEEIYGEIHWPITTSLFFHFLATMNNSHRTEENFTTKDQKDN